MKKNHIIAITATIIFFGAQGLRCQPYYDTSILNEHVKGNVFLTKQPDMAKPPAFDEVKSLLPIPHWPANPEAISSYWRIWELEFANLYQATADNDFVSPFIEPPFNEHIFMWDNCFITMFGRYGHRAFDFQAGALDNFYRKQHIDGFICRAISRAAGKDRFSKYDPSSTGPNLMPWAEWEHFLNFGDTTRLKEVFPPLLAYYQWFRTHRTWPDGSYFSSGWGCGMDNQPRLPEGEGFDPRFSTGFMAWIDINLQQILAGKILIKMADILGREDDAKDIAAEMESLTAYVTENMWDAESAFFYDRYRNGTLNGVKSIAAFWSLLAGVVPPEDTDRFIRHLENPDEFARVHRVATLSADAPGFDPGGGYWRGAVWAPTNYMVLKGLTKYGRDSLAFEIALNHLTNVAKVFTETGAFYENYSPDAVRGVAMKNFIGWNGVIPITNMFEYVFGLRPDVPQNTLIIDVRLTDEYGVKQYPFGRTGLLDISCEKRKKDTDKPIITIQANEPVTIVVKWNGGERVNNIKPGKTTL